VSDLIQPPKRTSELVVAHMHELIRSGEWPVGERIPAEPDLVGRFGVGRNTIREAVRALEHVGMLVPRRGDGTYVRSANPYAAVIQRSATTELLDLLQVRRALESEAAAGAARTATVAAKRRVRKLLDAAETALASGESERYDAADIDFHAGVVAASGNGLLIEIYAGVVEAMRRSHAEVTGAVRAVETHPVGHRDLVDAIERGDADGARLAVHTYLAEAEKEVRR
jgi:DNA-binding FadR family transcriptional regulator